MTIPAFFGVHQTRTTMQTVMKIRSRQNCKLLSLLLDLSRPVIFFEILITDIHVKCVLAYTTPLPKSMENNKKVKLADFFR